MAIATTTALCHLHRSVWHRVGDQGEVDGIGQQHRDGQTHLLSSVAWQRERQRWRHRQEQDRKDDVEDVKAATALKLKLVEHTHTHTLTEPKLQSL